MSCYGCNNDLYGEYSELLRNQELTLAELPDEITKNVYIVQHQKKIRLPEPDSDGDNVEYIIQVKYLCKKCYVCSIHHYYECIKRLPFLRRDIHWFKEPDISIYDEIKDKYIVPKVYNIYYYRQKTPEENKDGKLVINQQ